MDTGTHFAKYTCAPCQMLSDRQSSVFCFCFENQGEQIRHWNSRKLSGSSLYNLAQEKAGKSLDIRWILLWFKKKKIFSLQPGTSSSWSVWFLVFLNSPWYNRTGWLGVKYRVTYFFCTPILGLNVKLTAYFYRSWSAFRGQEEEEEEEEGWAYFKMSAAQFHITGNPANCARQTICVKGCTCNQPKNKKSI